MGRPTFATTWHEAQSDGAIREYGRSFETITWLDDDQTVSKLIGADLVKGPCLALDPTTGSAIPIIGSRDGRWQACQRLTREDALPIGRASAKARTRMAKDSESF